jgi:NADPH-dependent 2,4-dienoyl-CoA reductase/sulfur reductase-like enzyme
VGPRHVDVLLVGGGVASVRCARTLRRRDFSGSILMVGDEPHAPYNRPPLTKELLRDEVPNELVAAEAPGWYERHGVELRTGTTVTSLDAGSRRARLSDGSEVTFDRCLLATGAEPRRLSLPGAERTHVLRTLDDALALRTYAGPGTRIVVIGGGFLGVEAAASLAARGASVTVLEATDQLWSGSLGPELSAWGRRVLEGAGVVIRTATAATRVEPDAVMVGAERLGCEHVLVAIGVAPRQAMAADAALAVGDGILVDRAHRTSAGEVYAAGDVANVDGRRVEHWHAAREGGERAALAMIGEPPGPPRAPWIFSEFAGQMLDVVGHAPTWEATRLIGDPSPGGFAVAYLVEERVAQLATVNAAIPVDQARAFIEGRPRAAELDSLRIGS